MQNSENKLDNMEKRLKLLLETNFCAEEKLMSGETLSYKETLAELSKENLKLKSIIKKKDSELLRTKNQLGECIVRISKLTTQVDIYKSKLNIQELEKIQWETKLAKKDRVSTINTLESIKEEGNYFKKVYIPNNIDFRNRYFERETVKLMVFLCFLSTEPN